ncbi:VCBS repeat-containing protein, partial [Mesorhizobium salmacidum]
APVLSSVATSATYTENAAAQTLSPSLTVSDDDNTTLVGATIRISAGGFAGDVLAAITTGTSISATWNAANESLFLSGSDTLAHYQQVLGTVTFSSTSDNPTDFGGDTTRTIEWQVNDGTPVTGDLYQGQTQYSVQASIGGPFIVAMGDLNGDGRADLVAANVDANNVAVLLGDGQGGFGPATTFATGIGPTWVAMADLNGDGKLDLVTSNVNSSNASVLLGDGLGGFGAATNFNTGTNPRSVSLGDVNGDGKLDMVTGNQNSNSISVLLGNGDGTFAATTNFTVAGGAHYSTVLADLNGDGKLDL